MDLTGREGAWRVAEVIPQMGPSRNAFRKEARGFIDPALTELFEYQASARFRGWTYRPAFRDLTAFFRILTETEDYSHVIKEEAPTGPWDKLRF